MDEEIRRFEWKVEAGAEYVVTQPVFDLKMLEAFLRRIEHVHIPVICGIWPLTSYRNAEFMVNELRVPVPDEFMDRMRRVDNADRAREEGVAIAREIDPVDAAHAPLGIGQAARVAVHDGMVRNPRSERVVLVLLGRLRARADHLDGDSAQQRGPEGSPPGSRRRA